jgi:Xaa-Pro aminopeptidase
MNVRVSAIQGSLRRLGVDAILLNSSEVVPSVNLRYLTGFTGSDASVMITRSGLDLFTDGRYQTQAAQQAPDFRLHVVRRKFDSIARVLRSARVRRVGIEAARVSHEFVTTLQRKLTGVKLVPLNRRFVEGLRIRKSPEEKEKIAGAARIASSACEQLLTSKLEGWTETEVADALETLFRRHGADGVAFDTIVASGERSALPHGKASNKVIRRGELVIIDFGCTFEGYNSDETVTCVVGRASSDQRKMHKAVYEAHMKAIDSLKIGVAPRDVDRVARNSLHEAGYGKWFLHGLGHGLGLEVHEPPYLSPLGKGVIEEGMVFTVEPGVYIEGIGGVRLESLVYMDKSGPELLSRMSKELLQIS